METILESSMQTKPIELGEGLIIRNLDDKTFITGQSRTHLKNGDFLLDAEVIHIEAGPGIKISSKGKNTLVISCNLTKMEAQIFDLKESVDKRLETIEKIFTKIIKDAKK